MEGITFYQQDYRAKEGQTNYNTPPNLTLSHEGVGYVFKIGQDVKNFKIGDRVIISEITKCGKCDLCLNTNYCNCSKYNFWHGVFGNDTFAEYVKIPAGDYNLFKISEDIKLKNAVIMSDVALTAYEEIVQK